MSDFKARIIDFKVMFPNTPDPFIVCRAQVVDTESEAVLDDVTFQWSGRVFLNKPEEEVLEQVMENVTEWSQGVIAAATEETDKSVEFARKFQSLINHEFDIPDVAEKTDFVSLKVSEIKQAMPDDVSLVKSVRDTIDLSPREEVLVVEEPIEREIGGGVIGRDVPKH